MKNMLNKMSDIGKEMLNVRAMQNQKKKNAINRVPTIEEVRRNCLQKCKKRDPRRKT